MTTALPLNALRAFAAAARHQHFAKAADELHVTAGAISRQIRLLEEELGQLLFERLAQGVRLTVQGRALAAEIAPHLDGLTRAVARARVKSSVLTVSAPPTFGQEWLLPRLEDFQRQHPDIEVFLDASSAIVPLGTEGGAQAAIRYGRGDWQDGETRLLLREWIFPVCSPTLIPAPLAEPAALLAYPLLHAEWPGGWRSGRPSSRFNAWQDWFASQQVPLGESLRGPRYSLSGMALQQAAAGKGVALGGCVLAQRLLASGALVRPLPDRFNQLSTQAYFLVLPKGPVDAPVQRWIDWLLVQIRQFRETQGEPQETGGAW
ncbi:LysR substrate-binding domain-containing protein [Pseudomonas oryzihabitans]|uniref:LysR family transcriptional regulator, glycine cleavage system transcriptional activator n=1 Tax=Pseudomonas oryzihabitans TaxID=47885 RepID=A0A1G5P5K1_9PSED|nr:MULTISPECIES: LysR substrate-binding domain-containing protein [Pseudomonas]NMY91424.1 LysR family transcriptional regulator [Pseudomonas psychrotolerans]SCZ44796.1 LysR family transcriptional regulator, glycine cleavage system transcriptional activator [Pseudomonas psychrotolerans]